MPRTKREEKYMKLKQDLENTFSSFSSAFFYSETLESWIILENDPQV